MYRTRSGTQNNVFNPEIKLFDQKKESNPTLCNKLIFKNRVYILNHIFHNKSSCFVMMHSGGPENRSFLALQPIHTMEQKKIMKSKSNLNFVSFLF